MSPRVLVALAALVLAPSAVAQSDAELQALYTDFLTGQGVDSFVDSDGDVQFDRDGQSYYIGTNSGDPSFFNVVLFNVWPIESATERVTALNAVNEVSKELKVVKGYVTDDDNVWLACELFVEAPADFAPVFDRCLSTLETALDRFADAM
jgi:hypothetical protein